MEFKSLPTEFKVDDEKREIEAYVSTFDYKDSGGDIVKKGAFTKTLQENQKRIKVLWQHDPFTPVGLPKHMEEDSKGLYAVSKISKTAQGNDLLTLTKDNVITDTSIGFQTVKDDRKDDNRELQEVKLWEYSFVTWGMNDQALITGSKSEDLIPYLRQIHGFAEGTKTDDLTNGKRKQIESAIQSLKSLLDDDPKPAGNDDAKDILNMINEIKQSS